MSLWLIIGLVVLLYARTLKYNYVIDDYVRREGYMYEVPLTQPKADFWKKRPPIPYRMFMIGMHCVNVSIIYLIWGWAPALIFAVHPIGVIGTAWVTGNYYATAAYFTLIAFYFIHTFGTWWSALIAAPIYLSALYSTVNPLAFPFVFIFGSSPVGFAMFPVLAFFFTTKKWNVGIGIRKKINNEMHVSTKFHPKRLVLMTKLVGRYIFNVLWPMRMGFFDGYGHRLKSDKSIYLRYCSMNKTFWITFILCWIVFLAGLKIHPFGICWFFIFTLLHSQWNLTGQFFALRYMYLAMVGMCVVVGTLLAPYPIAMAVVVTYLIIRTNIFIPTWRNQESIWKNDMMIYPEYAQTYNSYAQHIMAVVDPVVDQSKPNPGCPAWKVNELGGILFKAEYLEPDSWEIQMNIAAYMAFLGQIQEAINRTKKAVEYLRRESGDEKQPMKILTEQVVSLENYMKAQEKAKQEALVKQQGALPDSPPPNQGGSDDDKRKEAEGTPELVGASGAQGREAGTPVNP